VSQVDAERADEWLGALKQHPIGGYQFHEFLGHGVSAAVFRATSDSGESVAVKIYESRFTEEERLRRELELRGHDCPFLVKIYGGGSATVAGEEVAYLAMELVHGKDLRELIHPEYRFRDADIRRMLLHLHDAAKYLLDRGMCHRDIKPENIRIRSNGDLVLLDLGVMKPIAMSDLTDDPDSGRRFLGSRRYAPPEFQHRTEEDSLTGWEAVTVYQVGAVLYEMIQGVRLFSHVPDQPPADLVVAINTRTPQLQRSDVGQDLVSLARRCLTKDAGMRLKAASMTDVAEVANTAYSPPEKRSAKRALDQVLVEAAERYEGEVQQPLDRLKDKTRRRAAIVSQALAIVRELLASRWEMTPQVHVEDKLTEGTLVCALFPERLEKRIVGQLRFAVFVSGKADDEYGHVAGLGFYGRFIAVDVKSTKDLFQRDEKLSEMFENIWLDPWDPEAFREALDSWLDDMLIRYIELTEDAYQAKMAQTKQDLEERAKRPARTRMVVTEVTPRGMVFTRNNHREVSMGPLRRGRGRRR